MNRVATRHDPTIHLIRGDELTPGQRREIIDLCTRAYEEDYEPFLDSFQGATHVLAYVEDKLVSHALWITRWLQQGDGPLLRTAYVEGVATDPDCQGRGYASAVMRMLQEHIQDYDLGGLCTSHIAWYARLGWELWRGPLYIRAEGKALSTPDEQVMIMRLPRTPDLNLEAPLAAEWRTGELW